MSYLITRTASPRRVRARLAGIGVATQEKKIWRHGGHVPEIDGTPRKSAEPKRNAGRELREPARLPV